jgi:hypothetical protein
MNELRDRRTIPTIHLRDGRVPAGGGDALGQLRGFILMLGVTQQQWPPRGDRAGHGLAESAGGAEYGDRFHECFLSRGCASSLLEGARPSAPAFSAALRLFLPRGSG